MWVPPAGPNVALYKSDALALDLCYLCIHFPQFSDAFQLVHDRRVNKQKIIYSADQRSFNLNLPFFFESCSDVFFLPENRDVSLFLARVNRDP